MAVTPPPKFQEDDPLKKPGADEFINEGASYKTDKNESSEDDLKVKKVPSTMISLRVPDQMLKQINELWQAEGGTLSRNSWLLQKIQDYLKSCDN